MYIHRRRGNLGPSRLDGVADLAPEPLEPFVEHLVAVIELDDLAAVLGIERFIDRITAEDSTIAITARTASRGTVRPPRTFFSVSGCGVCRSGMREAKSSTTATIFVDMKR